MNHFIGIQEHIIFLLKKTSLNRILINIQVSFENYFSVENNCTKKKKGSRI